MIWLVNILILLAVILLTVAVNKGWLGFLKKKVVFRKVIAPLSWRKLFWAVVVLEIVILFWVTRELFLLWQNSNSFSRFLVPPYASINYFLFYAGTRIWAPYLVSWVIGFLFFSGLSWLNKRRGSLIFYDEELYFIWLGIFLVGHPAWIWYLIMVLTVALILIAASRAYLAVRKKKGGRFSLYYLWLILAIVAILTEQWLALVWPYYLEFLI